MKADREKGIVAVPVQLGSNTGSHAGTGILKVFRRHRNGSDDHVVIDELAPPPPEAAFGQSDQDRTGLGIDQVADVTCAPLVCARRRV